MLQHQTLNKMGNRQGHGLEGFILIGGASSRMGSDKARLELGGSTFVERIAAALSSVAETVRCVGAKKDNPPGLINVPDLFPGWGALGGLHAALSACSAEWSAIVACDIPLVTRELFMRLATLRENFDAVVPVQGDGRPQPLCALYRCEPCLAKAAALIAEGERRPRALLAAVNTRWVTPSDLDDLDGAGNFFWNINTPDDYAQAQALLSAGP
ncbi:MAG TPA: molybdenum cofactor guanylyltransferase [Pyrinomonadaceae bacterium]|jgi:molybdopterin-guanine dinucleotide biosynthesis protein A